MYKKNPTNLVESIYYSPATFTSQSKVSFHRVQLSHRVLRLLLLSCLQVRRSKIIARQEQKSRRPNGLPQKHLLTRAPPTSPCGLRWSCDTNLGSSQWTTPEICMPCSHRLLSPPLPLMSDLWQDARLSSSTPSFLRKRTIRKKSKRKWSAARPNWWSQNSIPGSVLPAEQKVWCAPSRLHIFLPPFLSSCGGLGAELVPPLLPRSSRYGSSHS